MVGGAIAWKTNVMNPSHYAVHQSGNFSLGIALGMILLAVFLLVNVVISLLQRRLSNDNSRLFPKPMEQKKSAGFSGNGIAAWKHICDSRANGSGKSTFSKILQMSSGMHRKIRLEPSIGLSSPEALCLSYVCQKKHPAGRQGYPDSESLAKALSLTELEHKRRIDLSGGETARMAMA